MFLDPPIATLPLVRDGQVRAIAVCTRELLPVPLEMPTFAEAALPGYEVQGWNGRPAPAGTPRAVVERPGQKLRGIPAAPEVRAQLARHGSGTQRTGAFRRPSCTGMPSVARRGTRGRPCSAVISAWRGPACGALGDTRRWRRGVSPYSRSTRTARRSSMQLPRMASRTRVTPASARRGRAAPPRADHPTAPAGSGGACARGSAPPLPGSQHRG